MGKQLRVLRARTAGDYTTLCKEGARRMDVFRAFQRTRWYARIAIVPTSQVANRLRSSEYRRSGRDGKGDCCLADISFMRSTWRLTLLSIFRDRWRCRRRHLRAMALISCQLKLNRARDSNHLPFVYGATELLPWTVVRTIHIGFQNSRTILTSIADRVADASV